MDKTRAEMVNRLVEYHAEMLGQFPQLIKKLLREGRTGFDEMDDKTVAAVYAVFFDDAKGGDK